jgi:hypothetical protein
MGVTKTIYVLRDPETQAIRYVGATTYPYLNSRLKVHVAMCREGTSPCALWVRGLVDRGLSPVIEAVRKTTEDWEAEEREAIVEFRAAGHDLLNVALGGMGCHGVIPNEATRAKRSRTLKDYYANNPEAMAERQELMRRAARSDAARTAASNRMRGIWSDPEKAAGMRERMKGAKARKASCL